MDGEAHQSGPELGTDAVEDALAEVRRDLAARRERGELPHLPADELDRQFSAVVESVEAGIVEQPPLIPGDLHGPAVLESWRPMAGKGPAGRAVALLLSPVTRVIGLFVRRQVGEFSTRTAAAVEELAARQNKILFFLSRTHLDRTRRLEFRVAELEREVEQLRAANLVHSSAPDRPGA